MANHKQEITETLLALMPDNKRPSVEEAMLTWWFNIRDGGGLRLTKTGYNVLRKDLKLETWYFELKNARSNKNKRLILALDRKLQWPYYMEKNWVEFFSSKEAMMANLYPDLESFLSIY